MGGKHKKEERQFGFFGHRRSSWIHIHPTAETLHRFEVSVHENPAIRLDLEKPKL